jgi:hypothetical protein
MRTACPRRRLGSQRRRYATTRGPIGTSQGGIQALPSTVRLRPTGELVTVIETGSRENVAVTVVGAFIVRFCGVVEPESPPGRRGLFGQPFYS